MSHSSNLRPFLAGVALAYISVALLNSWGARKQQQRANRQTTPQQQQHAKQEQPTDDDNTSSRSEDRKEQQKILDSPTLDQRMIRKAEGAIRRRTSRLIIVIERCTNDHNYSAIHRTAEALGVQHIYVINPPVESSLKGAVDTEDAKLVAIGKGSKVVKNATEGEVKDRAMHHLFAQKATEWLDVTEFDDTASCLAALRKDNYEIWATDLSQEAVCLTGDDLIMAQQEKKSDGNIITNAIPQRLAIVFGTEAVGCTAEMLKGADMRVYLPLRGFADSLNLSVATALVVHHLFMLDPTLIGAMSEEERIALRKNWYAKLCRQRLLTSGKKRERTRLAGRVRTGKEYEQRAAAGEKLDANQLQKVAKLKESKAQLDSLDLELDEKAELAVKDLVANPPQPITDMRRADEHRVTFVGKGTKKRYGDTWADMPATANAKSVHDGTSKYFREKANNILSST